MDEKMHCTRCNKLFEPDGTSSLCLNCRRKRNTNVYTVIGIIIIASGLILGSVLGSTYKKTVLIKESSISSAYNDYEEKFNTELMFTTWCLTSFMSIIPFMGHSICYRLDKIIDKN